MFEEFKNRNWWIVLDTSAGDSIRVSIYKRHTKKVARLHYRCYFPTTRLGTIKALNYFDKRKGQLKKLRD